MLFGKYCLLERVSVGGMAEVFRAKPFHAPQGKRHLALKRILPHLAENDEFIQMFIDEAKLTVQLRHPNIVQIYELGQFQSSYYILMEYIAGQDLLALQKLARRERSIMSVAQACFIIKEVARGMDYAHRKVDANGAPLNIIHRDISPQNVLVSYAGDVKVIDFGIAKAAVQNTHTQVGVLKGKFGYMSPEQVSGLPIDRRSDIFAMGTLFWELLTNRRLFKGEHEFDTMQQIKNPEVMPPSLRNPEVPEEVERIVLRALAKDREERYQWASELGDELETYLANLSPPYQQGMLNRWMVNSFAEGVIGEREKQEEFRGINSPQDVQRLFVDAYGSGVDDTDNESGDSTQIWDADIAPSQGEDLSAFVANHTVVQAGGFELSQLADDPHAAGVLGAEAETHETGPRPHIQEIVRQSTDLEISGTQPDVPAGGPKFDGRTRRQMLIAVASVLVFAGLASVFMYMVFGQHESSAHGAGAVVVDVIPPSNLEIVFGGISHATQAPATIQGVAPGIHLLEVRHSDYETYQQAVEVSDDGVLPIRVELTPRRAPTGTLVLSWPDDEEVAVYIDGEIHPVDSNPMTLEVAHGERLIEVRPTGRRAWSKYIDVEAGDESEFDVEFEPIGLNLSITATSNGRARLNGENLGRTPVTLEGLNPSKLHDFQIGRWRTTLGFPEIGAGELEVDPRRTETYQEGDFGWFTATTGQDWWGVYVDGVDTGLVTPIRLNQKVPVLAGARTITFKRGRKSVDVKIDVDAGETNVIRENLPFSRE
ncbi:MAG: serine/threonine protein kinase [Bradymonadaceae bacterium]